MRTYYTWQYFQSSDQSYMLFPLGSWSAAELSAGIVVSCSPVMPRFFQHVGPKAYGILTFGLRSTKSAGYDQSARTASQRTHTFIKIANPLDKYDTRASIPDVEIKPDAQIHAEHYMLDALTQPQARMAPGVGIPTRRDDLEFGLPSPEVLATRINAKRQNI